MNLDNSPGAAVTQRTTLLLTSDGTLTITDTDGFHVMLVREDRFRICGEKPPTLMIIFKQGLQVKS